MSCSVAYGLDDYNYYRKDGPLSKKHAAARERVTWKKTPPKEIAFQDYAAWYIPEVSLVQCPCNTLLGRSESLPL
jgi:hypothetical protein